MFIVKISYRLFAITALRYTVKKKEVVSEKPVCCIFIFWVNTQTRQGAKRCVLVEKLAPLDKILR